MSITNTTSTEERKIYSISQLNEAARLLLEKNFPAVWVEGEISNLVRASSGHWYFSLKDSQAQLSCAMFRQRNQLLRFTPENGMHVIVRGKISLYENRGNFQLIADSMEEAGFGALQREFEMLYKKLENEGLFRPEHKKPLPSFPKKLGVITSSTGAAVHDILTTLKRRFPSLPVIIYPSLVQGKEAAASLIHALEQAQRRQECDLLIMARGGGSREDLWPFNNEMLARAIFSCSIPLISAIGHEIDFTLADFVADHRAPTPTGAAEIASPNGAELLTQIAMFSERLLESITKKFLRLQENILWLKKRLIHPGQRLQQWSQRLDFIEHQLFAYETQYIQEKKSQLQTLHHGLISANPSKKIQTLSTQVLVWKQQLINYMNTTLEKRRQSFLERSSTLEALSPLKTLNRGYAILSDEKNHGIISDAKNAHVGQKLTAKLGSGQLICEVEKIVE